MDLSSSRIFITGASGFIGSRIAERLWLDHHLRARCLVHNFSGASRVARLPVTMYRGNILDKAAMQDCIGDSNVIFHCAYGNTPDPALNARINEEGLQNLGEAALRSGVERFVHLSTVAVYGPDLPERITEETPCRLSQDEYGNSKIRAESICHELSKQGLPVAIIRPTVVFGPFSPIWTVGAIKRVLSGGWENTQDIHGLCNPVYIDDLVNGLFLCVDKDDAIGETFILSGKSPMPWNDYYGAYKALAHPEAPTAGAPSTNPFLQRYIGQLIRTNVNFLRKFMEPQLIDLYERLKVRNPSLAHGLYRLFSGGIQDNEKSKFNQKAVFSIEKAARLLGYNPRPFAERMALTADWLRYYEYI